MSDEEAGGVWFWFGFWFPWFFSPFWLVVGVMVGVVEHIGVIVRYSLVVLMDFRKRLSCQWFLKLFVVS